MLGTTRPTHRDKPRRGNELIHKCSAYRFESNPCFIINFLAELYSKIFSGTNLYGITPKGRFIEQLPLVSGYLHTKLLNGQIIMKKNIKLFTENGVIFEGKDVKGQFQLSKYLFLFVLNC